MSNYIPQDDARRKGAPMFRGLLGYFPAALFEVAEHSRLSNDKHNPGEDLHWARGKSSDHADCIVRHLIDAGKRGTKGRRDHLRALAWRALALLQEDCEADGAAPGVSSVFPSTVEKIREKVAKAAEARKLFPECLHPAQQLAIDAFRREGEAADVFDRAERNRFAALSGGSDDFGGDEYASEAVR